MTRTSSDRAERTARPSRLAATALAALCLGWPRAVLPAPSPEAEAEVVAVVHLKLVRGLDGVELNPHPLRRPLDEAPRVELETSALPEGDWLHGVLPLTNVDGLAYAVSADRRILFFDGDGDRRLVASERHDSPRRRGAVSWFHVTGRVKEKRDGQLHEVQMPLAVGIPAPPATHAFTRLDAHRRGQLSLDGRTVPLAVIDRTYRGWFGHRGRDRLLLDVDGDGRFDVSEESHERFRLGVPFPFGEHDLVVTEIAPLGQSLTIVRSERPARRLQPLVVGSPAADFEAKTLDGTEVSSASLRGRWVLLDFWASWCRPCVAEVPHIKELRKAHPDLEVLGISGDRQQLALERFVETHGVDWPQVFDQTGTVTRAYRVRSFPRSYLVAPDGTIAAKDPRGTRLATVVSERMKEWDATHRPLDGGGEPVQAAAGPAAEEP